MKSCGYPEYVLQIVELYTLDLRIPLLLATWCKNHLFFTSRLSGWATPCSLLFLSEWEPSLSLIMRPIFIYSSSIRLAAGSTIIFIYEISLPLRGPQELPHQSNFHIFYLSNYPYFISLVTTHLRHRNYHTTKQPHTNERVHRIIIFFA